MEIFNSIPPKKLKDTAVCIGKFDGIHKGHKLLIDDVVSDGKYTSLMLTFLFENRPQIYTETEKINIVKKLGIDVYVELPVTKELFDTKPEVFVRDILCKRLGASRIVVGKDFRFGRKRSGDIYTLDKLKNECSYELYVYEKLKDDNGIEISSSKIRDYLKASDIKKAGELLGRNYSISGRVGSGDHIGKKLGAATANITVSSDKLLPKYGVYAVRIKLKKGEDTFFYNGIANLGKKPTIGDDYPVGLEVNIFDFESDIYGEDIEVEFISFIREEKKFGSVEELKKQMSRDIERVKSEFKV